MSTVAVNTREGPRFSDTEKLGNECRGRFDANDLTFVLVHGAWHGGWCWRAVEQRLAMAGCRVLAPTLTGLGERQHLGGPHVNLETHIQDILNVLIWEELSNVVLVGHSYAGMVVTGVADRAPDWVTSLVYVDAVLPSSGQSMLEVLPPDLVEESRSKAINGQWLPAEEPHWFGVPVSDTETTNWMKRRLTPHPLGTLLQPFEFTAGDWPQVPKTYIRCTRPPLDLGSENVDRIVSSSPGWTRIDLETGHNAMITAPDELSAIILKTHDLASAVA